MMSSCDATYHVFIEDGLIVLFPINEKDFENGIKPVVDTIGSLTYFSNYDENFLFQQLR